MNKQTSTILAVVAVLVVIAIAALAMRNQTPEPTPSQNNDVAMMEEGSTETEEEESDSAMMELDAIEDGAYTLNTEDSTVEWEGRKTLVANYKDSGTLNIASGDFNVANGSVSGGTVVFDMTSINATYVTLGAGEENLNTHLKSPDFFDVEQYPTATFAVIGSEPGAEEGTLNVRGNLTIKGSTHEASIPVQIGMQNGRAVITGTAEIDRTLYDVRFGSDKFFDNLADGVIDDMFMLDFTLIADAQ